MFFILRLVPFPPWTPQNLQAELQVMENRPVKTHHVEEVRQRILNLEQEAKRDLQRNDEYVPRISWELWSNLDASFCKRTGLTMLCYGCLVISFCTCTLSLWTGVHMCWEQNALRQSFIVVVVVDYITLSVKLKSLLQWGVIANTIVELVWLGIEMWQNSFTYCKPWDFQAFIEKLQMLVYTKNHNVLK